MNHQMLLLPSDNLTCIDFVTKQSYTKNHLLNLIASIQKKIVNVEGSWLLYAEDSYLFLAGFLSLVGLGKNIQLPQNYKPNSISTTSLNVMSDTMPFNNPILQYDINKENERPVFNQATNSTITLNTSGSTGEPKSINKKLQNFISEIECFETFFKNELDECIFLATVSHQHIYGLIFKALLPFFLNIPFYKQSLIFPNEIESAILESNKIFLVSSPSHLSRLPQLCEIKDWQNKIAKIISSGGPLDQTSALEFEKKLGYPPTEIFGSTETGGIAIREQINGNLIWQKLPDVQISKGRQNNLIVSSPFIYENSPFHTEDLVELKSKEQFLLLGRKDRIVKIDEKRVSLPEMETHIKSTNLVKDALVLPLKKNEDSSRITLGCLIEIDSKYSHSRQSMINEIKKHLQNYYENNLIPKTWRFTNNLPKNNQSKISFTEVENILIAPEQSEDIEIVKINKTANDQIEITCKTSQFCKYYKGHFPEQPILPGIVQVDLAIKKGKEFLGLKNNPTQITNLKFKKVIQPKDTFNLILKTEENSNYLDFVYCNAEKLFSQGRIKFDKGVQNK